MTIKLHVLIRKITKSTRSIFRPIRNIIWSIYFVRTVKIFKKIIFKIHCFIIHYYNKLIKMKTPSYQNSNYHIHKIYIYIN